ncbi:MAG TPA: TolC family protein [Chitinophagaceae bacterium]|nr:TolC family protein [Chitinophagaceae bacterium]
MPFFAKTAYFYVFALLLAFPGLGQTRDLDFYLQQGLAASPLLRDYSNQLRSGELDSLLIQAANKPQVMANGEAMVAPQLGGFGYDQIVTNGGLYAAQLSVTQPLFNKKILQPQYEAVRLNSESIANTSRLSQIDLERTITTQYLVAYSGYSQYQTTLKVYKLFSDQQELLKQLAIQGVYKQTDYLSFLVTLQSQEITLGQLDLQYRSAVATLNYLCGINDTGMVDLAKPVLEPVLLTQKDTSPFFHQFVLDSLKIINGRQQVDTRYRPSVSWFANAGLNSSSLLTAYRNYGASVGITLSVPIYDGKQRQLDYRKLNLSEDTRLGYAQFFGRQYNQQVAMLVQQLGASDILIGQIRDKLANSALLINLDKKLLNSGDVRITDYILAINNYLTIENDRNQALVSRWQIVNQLNYWNH